MSIDWKLLIFYENRHSKEAVTTPKMVACPKLLNYFYLQCFLKALLYWFDIEISHNNVTLKNLFGPQNNSSLPNQCVRVHGFQIRHGLRCSVLCPTLTTVLKFHLSLLPIRFPYRTLGMAVIEVVNDKLKSNNERVNLSVLSIFQNVIVHQCSRITQQSKMAIKEIRPKTSYFFINKFESGFKFNGWKFSNDFKAGINTECYQYLRKH